MPSILLIDDEVDFADCLREELEAQASRKRWLGSALPALDCREAAKFAALHPAA